MNFETLKHFIIWTKTAWLFNTMEKFCIGTKQHGEIINMEVFNGRYAGSCLKFQQLGSWDRKKAVISRLVWATEWGPISKTQNKSWLSAITDRIIWTTLQNSKNTLCPQINDYIYICVCVPLCIYMYICIHVHMYIYTIVKNNVWVTVFYHQKLKFY